MSMFDDIDEDETTPAGAANVEPEAVEQVAPLPGNETVAQVAQVAQVAAVVETTNEPAPAESDQAKARRIHGNHAQYFEPTRPAPHVEPPLRASRIRVHG
ncbi:hypothetical protein P3T40_003544 [Paraburkholderia sp. EB58]|uniref:hypothetical protein n=1 Tax=Paraburkholderia sp. EB58 TaxID=3035125 RepID=UPI003D1BC852